MKESNKAVQGYVASIPFDRRLYRQDIEGSIAHARMLARQEIIAESEAETIIKGLKSIYEEIEQGKFQFKTELEDIHMNIEARLFEKIGDVAGKLHTARSRNDQIALDLRLFLKEEIVKTIDELKALQDSLVELAEANEAVIMPGYTHLQQAQPVLLAHHLLAYFDMFQRDRERFHDCLKRTDVLSLGSGALAGVPYPVDREFVARELGFSKVSTNSLDAVSDRDFVIEYEAAAAITMMHLSRLAEELILWSSSEFGFIEIGEAYTTGSSIMPQKKNPDVAELVRGKTGRVYGDLTAILTLLKGLPLTYNRDLQEDKEPLFDASDTLQLSIAVVTRMFASIRVDGDAMRAATRDGFLEATDLADYLVKKGMPFRQAHTVVGQMVLHCVKTGRRLPDLSPEEFKAFSSCFESDVRRVLDVEAIVRRRDQVGGTAPKRVRAALRKARNSL
jgi:argininosuccinate lyase